MTTHDETILLIRSHLEGADQRFLATVQTIAANAEAKGRHRIAHDLRRLIERAGTRARPLTPLPHDLQGLLLGGHCPNQPLERLVLEHTAARRLGRLLDEQRARERIRAADLVPQRRALFHGPPGTGKTVTASAVACALELPLYVVPASQLFGSLLGESASRLRKVFDYINTHRGVYFFDEFDAIGASRTRENDTGEVRRMLNTLLQLLDLDGSDSVIIAATNLDGLLDAALFRRFDLVLPYALPDRHQIDALLALGGISRETPGACSVGELATRALGVSHAQILRACHDGAKAALLADTPLTTDHVADALSELTDSDDGEGEVRAPLRVV